jgi:hypothetical protein
MERKRPMDSKSPNPKQESNSQKAAQQQKHPAVEPSGPRGDNPSTAGPGHTGVQSKTPENRAGHLNPSAPEDANVTPGSAGEK